MNNHFEQMYEQPKWANFSTTDVNRKISLNRYINNQFERNYQHLTKKHINNQLHRKYKQSIWIEISTINSEQMSNINMIKSINNWFEQKKSTINVFERKNQQSIWTKISTKFFKKKYKYINWREIWTISLNRIINEDFE